MCRGSPCTMAGEGLCESWGTQPCSSPWLIEAHVQFQLELPVDCCLFSLFGCVQGHRHALQSYILEVSGAGSIMPCPEATQANLWLYWGQGRLQVWLVGIYLFRILEAFLAGHGQKHGAHQFATFIFMYSLSPQPQQHPQVFEAKDTWEAMWNPALLLPRPGVCMCGPSSK